MSPTGDAAPAGATGLLHKLSLFFFYLYVLTVVVAGAWGIFGARLDFPVLMHQQVGDLDPDGAVDVISQYRFLRGIELGFGVFALRYRREIFLDRTINHLFVSSMALGILGRLIGMAMDGVPSVPMLAFLGIEAVGITLIVIDSRRSVRPRHDT